MTSLTRQGSLTGLGDWHLTPALATEPSLSAGLLSTDRPHGARALSGHAMTHSVSTGTVKGHYFLFLFRPLPWTRYLGDDLAITGITTSDGDDHAYEPLLPPCLTSGIT